MNIENGKRYLNGRGDQIGPMDERAEGVFLDQYGRLYRPDGRQWDHHPESTGNIALAVDESEVGRLRAAFQRILDFKPDENAPNPQAQIAAFALGTAETVLQPRRS